MATKAKNVSITAKLLGETKNAVKYTEVDKNGEALETRDAKMGTVYLKKAELPTPFPEEITVTIAWK